MAGKKREDVREKDVTGLKYFDKLAPLLRLHDVGIQRDKAGNRELFFDQYCMLVLLFLFNPVVRSLRAIQQASELRKVQRKLGCLRASLGSLSEATDVFQPERLKEIIAELGEQLQPIARDSRLKDVQHTLTLVDGTLLKGLPVLAQARCPIRGRRSVKRNSACTPSSTWNAACRSASTLPKESVAAQADERAVLANALGTGRCYVDDRGYAKFTLFNAIVAAQSSYVCRLRDNSRYEIVEPRTLCDNDTEAGVLLDAIVLLGEDTKKADGRPDHSLRLVVVKTIPHDKRGGAAGPASNGQLLIATNLLDLPAWIIALDLPLSLDD